MAFRVEQFGDVVLPNYEPQIEGGSGEAVGSLVEIAGGGAYDTRGNNEAPLRTLKLSKRAVIYEDTRTEIREALDDLKALAGCKEKLYYRTLDSDEIRWLYARLEIVEAPREPGDVWTQDVILNWITERPIWNGAMRGSWYFDDGHYFDDGLYFDEGSTTTTLNTSPKTATVNNGGNAAVEDAIITVTAGSAAITALKIERKIGATIYEQLEFSGTIAAGNSLVIDVGAWSVLNNGVDAFDDLDLGADHASESWLRLLPGDNSIVVTFTGGSTDSTIRFDYWDAWK